MNKVRDYKALCKTTKKSSYILWGTLIENVLRLSLTAESNEDKYRGFSSLLRGTRYPPLIVRR